VWIQLPPVLLPLKPEENELRGSCPGPMLVLVLLVVRPKTLSLAPML